MGVGGHIFIVSKYHGIIDSHFRRTDVKVPDGLWVGETADIALQIKGDPQALCGQLGGGLQIFQLIHPFRPNARMGQGSVRIDAGGLGRRG